MIFLAMCLLAAHVTGTATTISDAEHDSLTTADFDGSKLVSYANTTTTWRTAVTIPNVLHDGPTAIDMTVGDTFDGFKLAPYANATSWDFWYFDVMSSTPSANESLAILFQDAGPDALVADLGSPLAVSISVTFADGTRFTALAKASAGTSATVFASDLGSSATWADTGFGWAGAPDATTYTVEIDSPQVGVKGTVVMNSLAPAHLPCGVPTSPTDSAELTADIGYSNAVPAASATVSLDINGRQLQFSGFGYHDNTWGAVPQRTAFQSWTFGRAQMGPYSLVWLDGLPTPTSRRYPDNFVTGYLARDGEVVFATCDSSAMRARPWGRNSEFPPSPTTGHPDGVYVEFNVGDDVFLANMTTELVLAEYGTGYGRYMGRAEGGFRDGETFSRGRVRWDKGNF